MEPTSSKVSVVIPVFNDGQRLEKCLEALEQQTYPRDCYELVVIDNASTEDIKSLVARFPKAHYCYEPRAGSYAARNKGLSVAVGEIIAFTDSDCIPAFNWIERGVATLREFPDCGLVGGAIKLFYRNPNRLTGVEIYESLKGFPQKKYIEEERFGATANVFTYRKTIDAVGQFNAELKSGGDSEWGKRVAAAGYCLHYADDVEVAHPARSTYTELYRKIVRVMSGLPAFRNADPVPMTTVIRRLARSLVPPFTRIRSTLMEAGEKSPGDKLKLVTCILFLHYVWEYERARLTSKSRTVESVTQS